MIKRLISFIIFVLNSTFVSAVVSDGMIVNDHAFLGKPDGYKSMEVDLQMTRAPKSDVNMFWLNQFFFVNGEGGETGFQQRHGHAKKAVFTIWNALGWAEVLGTNCAYASTSDKHSGVSCFIHYDWKEGQRYRLIWERVAENQAEQTWRSSVMNLNNQQTTIIGEIKLPKMWRGLSKKLIQVVDVFHRQGQHYPHCSNVPAMTHVFFSPFADRSRALNSWTKTYGHCESIAQSFCTLEHDCIATIHAKPYTHQTPFMLKNLVNGYCADNLAAGNLMGLYYCKSNNHQKIMMNYTHRLYLIGRSACLGVNATNQVSVESCTNSSNQRWLFIPSTQQYLHLKSGKCMDAAKGILLSKNIQIQKCSDSDSQKWTMLM